MNGQPPRILLLGSNSGRNAGDLALLDTVVDQITLRQPGAVFEIPTTNPAFIAKHFQGRNVVPLGILPWNLSLRLLGMPVLRSISRCDLSLILDGIIFDHRLLNPAFNFLITLVFLTPWARLRHRPMVCFEVGVGPLKTTLGRRCARNVAQGCDLITVREGDSERLLREVGVTKEIEVYADAAFIMRPASGQRVDEIVAGLETGGRPLVGLNLTRYGGEWVGKGKEFDKQAFQRQVAGIIDRFTEQTGAVVILTGTQHMDRLYLGQVRDLVTRREHVRLVTNVELSPAELTGLMGRYEMFVGMRLHSLILASSMMTPVLGMTYAPKVRSMFDLMERPELALDLGTLEPESLLETLIGFWGRRAKEKDRLRPPMEELKARAARGFDRLAERYF